MGTVNKISPQQIEQIRKLRSRHMKYKEIAEILHVSVSAAKKYGNGVLPAERRYRETPPEIIARVREMRQAGATYSDIYTELGIDKGTIKKYTSDIECNPRKNQLSDADIRQLRELREKGYSIDYICRLTGRSNMTVLKYTKGINPKKVIPVPPKPKAKVTGGLCPHKKTCRYWRYMSGLDCYACHYPVDNPVNRPWPADQCPGFPKKGTTKK